MKTAKLKSMQGSSSPAAQSAARAPRGMSEAEWRVRCDLAAAYRLVALYGWT